MRFFIISALFFLIACADQNDSVEDTSETIEEPFPRQYKGFYAGMSVDDFLTNLTKESYTISEEILAWVGYTDGVVAGPRYIADNGRITLTGFIQDGRMAKLKFEGMDDPFFERDVKEIFDIFGEENTKKSQKTLWQDSLKTHIDKGNDILIFTHEALSDKRWDEKMKFKEGFKKEMEENAEQKKNRDQQKYM